MKYTVRPNDVPAYSPPIARRDGQPATGGQGRERLTHVEMLLCVLEPGVVAERHSHDAQEQAMYTSLKARR